MAVRDGVAYYPVRNQGAYLGFKLTVEEKLILKATAVKQGLTVSELLRFLIREEARKAGIQ